jgi:hypothetical protein
MFTLEPHLMSSYQEVIMEYLKKFTNLLQFLEHTRNMEHGLRS